MLSRNCRYRNGTYSLGSYLMARKCISYRFRCITGIGLRLDLDSDDDRDFLIAADVDLDATQEAGEAVFTNYRAGFFEEL